MPDRFGKYSYFDSPDGTDGMKKAWYISKITAKLGFVSATLDAFLITAPATRLGVAGVYVKHLVPLVGAGLAYVSATQIVHDLRGVDDTVNHMVGTMSFASVMGAALRSKGTFFVISLFGIPLTHTLKEANMKGFKLYTLDQPIKKKEYFGPMSHVLEIGRRKDTLKERYDEKNEEWYRQYEAKQRDSGTPV